MSLKIRLARGGSKHRPYYNVVIADSRFARDGRFIEKIGSYNPLLGKADEKRIQIDLEKAKAWLAKGANLLNHTRGVLNRAGIGHGVDRGETTRGRRLASGQNGLTLLKTRFPKVRVKVN